MNIITFPTHANLQAVAALHGDLLSALDAYPAVTLDLATVVDCDLSVIQLVEAARREAARRGKTFALAAPANGAVRATLDRAGFLAKPSYDAHDFWLFGDLDQ